MFYCERCVERHIFLHEGLKHLAVCRKQPANMPNLHLFRREPSTVGVLKRPTKNRSHFVIMVAIATDQNLKVGKEKEFGAHARTRTPILCVLQYAHGCGSRGLSFADGNTMLNSGRNFIVRSEGMGPMGVVRVRRACVWRV